MTGFLVLTTRITLGVVFGFAVWSKMRGRAEFRDWVAGLGIVPARLTGPAAVAMIVVEGGAVLLIAVPSTEVAGLMLAGVVLAGFAGAIGLLRYRRVPVTCRCFGASAGPMGAAEIIRNTVLSGAALTASRFAGGLPGLPDVMLAALFGTALALLAIRSDEVFRLFAIPG
jgi:hypothetical protein